MARAAEAAPGTPLTRRLAGPSLETQRIVELERQLRRKDAALVETAALLVLKKSLGVLEGRERLHGLDARTMIVALIEEAADSGARRTTRPAGDAGQCTVDYGARGRVGARE